MLRAFNACSGKIFQNTLLKDEIEPLKTLKILLSEKLGEDVKKTDLFWLQRCEEPLDAYRDKERDRDR